MPTKVPSTTLSLPPNISLCYKGQVGTNSGAYWLRAPLTKAL